MTAWSPACGTCTGMSSSLPVPLVFSPQGMDGESSSEMSSLPGHVEQTLGAGKGMSGKMCP